VAGCAEVTVDLRPDATGTTEAALRVPEDQHLPYFGWLVGPLTRLARRRAMNGFARDVASDLAGRPRPPAPRWFGALPPVPVSHDQAVRLAAIVLVAMLANGQGSLLTQFVSASADTFGVGDRSIGSALAIIRAGVLVSLVAAAFADRVGRRRILLVCLTGAALASVVTALSPSFAVFTGSQLMVRSMTTAVLVVAAIGVVEEAPEGGRAWGVAMLGVALGAGYGVTVVLLPLADIPDLGWRLAFLAGAAAGLLAPSLRRSLRETKRYRTVAEHHTRRGRLRQVFGDYEGPRFLALGLAVFAVNVFAAPSSQLTNRYLLEEHDFSNTSVAVYRAVALSVPGLAGTLLGGILGERWGRRPVGIAGIAVATAMQMTFFLASGVALWLSSAVAILAATAAGVALGALGAELFPTEVRGTSNGLLVVIGVLGSAAGLVAATRLGEVTGSLGAGVALTGLAPLLAAFAVLPFLPETKARQLDTISPPEE
jgi:MFS family permease